MGRYLYQVLMMLSELEPVKPDLTLFKLRRNYGRN